MNTNAKFWRCTYIGVVAVAFGGACSSRGDDPAKGHESSGVSSSPSAMASPKQMADAERLRGVLRSWASRWKELGDLPACEGGDLAQRCQRAQAALASVKHWAAEQATGPDMIRALSELAVEAEHARLMLERSASLAGTAAKSPTTASPPREPAAARGVAAAMIVPHEPSAAVAPRSGGRSALVGAGVANEVPAVDQYSRAARWAADHLQVMLRDGSLQQRRDALSGFERIVDAHPHSLQARTLLAQALPFERDRELEEALRALYARTGTPQGSDAAAGSSPSGAHFLPSTAVATSPGDTPNQP